MVSAGALTMFSGKNIIIICGSETPAGVSEPLFHRWGRNGKRQQQRRFLRKRGAAERFPADLQRAEPSQALPRQLPRRGSQAVRLVAEVLGAMRKLPSAAKKLPLRGSWHRAAMTERVQPACAKQKLPPQRDCFRRKRALHLPLPSTTLSREKRNSERLQALRVPE